jgi:hypothetical protein
MPKFVVHSRVLRKMGYLLWLLVKVVVDRPIYYIATVAKMRKAIKKRASLVLR